MRRLLTEQALAHWPLYAVAFVPDGGRRGARRRCLSDRHATNEAYVHRNLHGIVVIGLSAMVIFIVKGFSTYGAAVTLSRIGNRIIANNQQRLFDKLLQKISASSPTAIHPNSSPASPLARPR